MADIFLNFTLGIFQGLDLDNQEENEFLAAIDLRLSM